MNLIINNLTRDVIFELEILGIFIGQHWYLIVSGVKSYLEFKKMSTKKTRIILEEKLRKMNSILIKTKNENNFNLIRFGCLIIYNLIVDIINPLIINQFYQKSIYQEMIHCLRNVTRLRKHGNPIKRLYCIYFKMTRQIQKYLK